MKLLVCIIIPLSCFPFNVAFGQQQNTQSLQDTLKQKHLVEQSHQKVDSIRQSFYQQSDSLKELYKSKFIQLDSTQARLQSMLDSVRGLQTSNTNALNAKIDSVQSRVKSRVDSLSISRQISKLTQALDSSRNVRDSTLATLDKKVSELKGKTIGKLNSLDIPPQGKNEISNVTKDIESYKIPGADLKLSSINSNTNVSPPGFNNLNLQSTTPVIPRTGGLENIKGEAGALSDIKNKSDSYSNDLKQLGNGTVDEVKEFPKVAESKAEELSGMNEVKEQTKGVERYKDIVGNMQNPDSLKSFIKQEIRRKAVNHFAGKEEQLKNAIETMSKYKNNYSSLNSLADAKKRPPNEMKGKLLIERIVPGIAMQIQKRGDNFMVDFNPYAGYRFTGRLSAGVGWNQRVAYDMDKKLFDPGATVFGPRIYGEFKLWKGFSPRVEGEVMNTKVPPSTITPSVDPDQHQWVWGAFAGLKKEYRFFKNIKGTALIMARLINPYHKSPYADVLNVRFGFEFPMKSKATKK